MTEGKTFIGRVEVTAYPEDDGGYTLYLSNESVRLSQKEADSLGRYLLFDEAVNKEEKND